MIFTKVLHYRDKIETFLILKSFEEFVSLLDLRFLAKCK